MSIRKRLFLTAVVTALSMALAFAGPQPALTADGPAKAASKTPAPQYGGVLKMLFAQSPTNMGYPPTGDGASLRCSSPAIENLVSIDARGQFQPTGLTTAFAVAPDGKSVTLTLRKGVKFHDGTDFNAQAVKWNLEKMKEAKAYGTSTWVSVDVINDYTARLNLRQADAGVAAFLGRDSGLIISPTAFQKNGLDWAMTHPIGTGPFKFKSFQRDASARYEKFADYWQRGLPYLDGMEFLFVTDRVVASASLQAAEAHVLWWATPQIGAELRTKGFQILAPFPTFMVFLGPDSINPGSILANKKVREALEYATNRREISDALGYGFWTALNQPVDAHYVAGYNPDLKGREYNPARAKQLLAEAGYPNGFRTKIFAEIEVVSQDAMVAVQSQWKAVGVDLALENVPRAKFIETRAKGWRDGFILGRTAVQETFSNTCDRILSVDGRTYVSVQRPPGWGDLWSQAVASLDYATYKARTQKLVRMMFDDATILPLWGQMEPFVLARNVHDTGFYSVNYTYWTPERAWLSR